MQLDSYGDAGALVAVELVNALASRSVETEPGQPASEALASILAMDPPSVAQLRDRDVPRFVAVAGRLREVFDALRDGNADVAAGVLNELLAEHPAPPFLAKEEGRWRLHHHAADAKVVPMWTSVCAEGLARLLAAGHAERLGTCEDAACGRVFVDVSRNATRRFCSTTCQNRVKAAAFRQRRVAAKRRGTRRGAAGGKRGT